MYLALITAAGVVSATLAALAWRHRRHPGFAYFAAMELAAAWWIACYLGEQLDPPRARLWFALKFPAIGIVTPSWLLFTLHQLGRRPRSRAWWLLYLWPVILLPLVLTNDTHHLFFTAVLSRRELVGVNGPLFAVHLAFSYGLLAGAAVLLARDWRRRRNIQTGLLLLGGLIPFAGNVLNEWGKQSATLGAWLTHNPTLPSFAFSMLLIGWATMRYRLLDPRPVAREALFESMPDVVIVLDETNVIVDANRAAARLIGRPDRDLLDVPWPDVFTAPEWQQVPHDAAATLERPWRGEDGTLWFEVQRQHLWDARGRAVGLLIVARDVTARRQFEEELRALSYRDMLTGLSNRRYFDDEVARLQASREFPVALFAFDLDGLKQVNDRDGHAAGDALLQAMASFLTVFFRAGDRVVRQGGDEFLVLLPATSADEAERIRARLSTALRQFNAGRSQRLRFSTGVAVATDAADWTAAMARADQRLYEAKRVAGALQL